MMARRIALVSASLLASLGLTVAGFGLGWARPAWAPPWLRGQLDRWPGVLAGSPRITGEGGSPGGRATPADDHPGPIAAGAARERRELPTVRLASEQVARQAGIETAAATELSHAHRLVANAETAYDTRRYATVSPRVAGFLREVRVDLGQVARRGEILAVVDSAEISAARTQFLAAQAAAALAQTTYERTAWLARTGQLAAALFAIADTRRMWLWIDVYESDISRVSLHQPVGFVISGMGGPTFEGEVTWTGTEVNPTTRITRVRAELANPEGRLRANQFGKASLRLGQEHRAVVIPEAAVQRPDGNEVVFVPGEDHTYPAVQVKTHPMDQSGVVEVVEGLESGRQVVTVGSYRLKSEVNRDAIVEG